MNITNFLNFIIANIALSVVIMIEKCHFHISISHSCYYVIDYFYYVVIVIVAIIVIYFLRQFTVMPISIITILIV